MKKVLSLALACTLGLSAIAGTAFAATPEADYLVEQGLLKGTDAGLELDRDATGAEALTMLYRVAGLEQEMAMAETTTVYGTLSVTDEEVSLKGEGDIEYVLHTENAMAVLGNEVKAFEEAKNEINGKEMGVVIGSTMTLSLPAQANALYFLVATETHNPIYMEISNVSEEEGVIKAESADGRYVAAMDKLFDLTPVKTRNIVKALDLKAGDKVIAYSDMMTMSIPALLNPTSVLVLEQSVKPEHWAGDIIADAEEKEFIATKSAETMVVYGTLTITEEGVLLNGGENGMFLLNTEEAVAYVGSEIAEIATLSGKEVAAVVSPNMTKSIPAKTKAFYILSASETENPIYMEISNVSEEEGVIKAESADGNYVVAADKMFDLTPARTKNIIKALDLKAGDKILVYSDMMTMSIPALLNPSKIVVLEQSNLFSADESIKSESFMEISLKMFAEKAQNALALITDVNVSRDTLVKFCYELLK